MDRADDLSAASAANPKPETANVQAVGSLGEGSLSAELARDELLRWIKSAPSTLDARTVDCIQAILNDQDGLKDKVSKLKSLLGRSAKAQREAKVELDATQKRLENALKEIDRLNKKIDKLANRPTHMDLLADFETNFDRALLSVGHQQTSYQQPGGQDTAPPAPIIPSVEPEESAVVESMLMQELSESKQRIERLEKLNAALVHRSSQLEVEAKERKRERDEISNRVSHLELEKRMAVMEADYANKALQEKSASLTEMQLEIELLTKASVNANVRAAQGEEIIKTVKTDRQRVQQLEAQVLALQEWASAAAEAKTLSQERVRLLENQLRSYQQQDGLTIPDEVTSSERLLYSQSGSLVIGAGDVGVRVFSLNQEHIRSLELADTVILRWKFDMVTEDVNIDFSILKGACETASDRKKAEYLVKDRAVTGGAAGENENAFVVQNSCTLVWSNLKSWVKPRTVKYAVQAIVLPF